MLIYDKYSKISLPLKPSLQIPPAKLPGFVFMVDVNCSFGARISSWPFFLVLSKMKLFQSLEPDPVYWIPSLALLFQHLCSPHGSTVCWSLLIPEWVWLSPAQCHPIAAVCAHPSLFPLFWVDRSAGSQPALPLSFTLVSLLIQTLNVPPQ